WAARRNMSSPPVIKTVGGVAVADTAPSVSFLVSQCNDYFFDVAASDTEQDVITYQAYFLQSWMSFSPVLHRLTVAQGGTVGQTYNVVLQVTTSSGGTDRIIARFYVCPCGGCSLSPNLASDIDVEAVRGPNPTHGAFAVPTPFVRGA